MFLVAFPPPEFGEQEALSVGKSVGNPFIPVRIEVNTLSHAFRMLATVSKQLRNHPAVSIVYLTCSERASFVRVCS